MNRMESLVVRRTGPLAPLPSILQETRADAVRESPAWAEDAKLFLTGWAGGLVFFFTFLG